jgi:hypothetical protein
MTSTDREFVLDLFAGSSAVLAFLFPIQINRIYHGYYGLSFEDGRPLSYLLISWLMFFGLWFWGCHGRYRMGQWWLFMSCLIGLTIPYGKVLASELGKERIVVLFAMLLLTGVVFIYKSSPRVWSGLRRVITIVPWLVVVAPVIAAQLVTNPSIWLYAPTQVGAKKTATVVMLFDELNANSSSGLRRVLTDHGLVVNWKPVTPIAGSTSEVVPAMFSGENFAGGKPCGLTQICSSEAMLDFSQVTVFRPDVDVVGFHHPYCAINGLRWCKRFTLSRSIFDEGRWDCALLNRFELSVRFNRNACQEISHKLWVDMRERLISALKSAPTLHQGGVLFVHLPIPHPPSKGTGSLAEQYNANLAASEELLSHLLSQLSENKIQHRIMIFSDHPLRQALWCRNESLQFDAPCKTEPSLEDINVPLIVAAKGALPSLDRVQSNKEVFDVLRAWLAVTTFD